MTAIPSANVVLFGGIAAVVVLDTVASWAARVLRFPYMWAIGGSLAIYTAVGFLTGKSGGGASPAFAAAMVGLAESTLGWAASWAIGPGKPATMRHLKSQIALVVLGTTAIAAVVGAAAGWVARRM